MSRPCSHLLPLLPAALCMIWAAPTAAGPRKISTKVRPNYLLQLQAPKLEDGVDSTHGPPLSNYLRSKLSLSPALALSGADADNLKIRALRRHLARRRLAGLSAVPKASCQVSHQGGNKTVVRCKVMLLLLTLRQQSLVSAYTCEAEVSSRRPSTPPEFIERMRKDVLAAAAEGVAEDLATFLEGNHPGTGRLPRRGR